MSDAPQQTDHEVNEGDILAGKYRVEQVLGRGGMGVVVAATHIVLQNRVALKFLLPSVAKHHQTAARFLREAQAAVKIKSPHVARVIDVGQMEDTGSPYMVMEYLEGKDLGAILEAEGALDVERACTFVMQTCEALAAAHAAGIVHRDIKPANLFITPSADGTPTIKVLDFGISKNVVDMGISNLTQTQVSMGSPLYMSPEQMRSARDVDARTDIWSLGVVLFEALTGQLPFMADTMPQLVALVLEEEAPAVDVLCPGLPPPLVEAVRRCLQKDRKLRFQHIGQLAEALAAYVPKGGALSAERTSRIVSGAGLDKTAEANASPAVEGKDFDVGVVAPPPGMRGTETSFGRTGDGGSLAPRRVSLPLALGIAGVLVGLGAIGVLLFSPSPPDSGGAAATVVNQMDAPSESPTPATSAARDALREPGSSSTVPSASATVTVHESPRSTAPGVTPAESAPTVKPEPLKTKPAKPGTPKKPKETDPFGDRF